MSGNIILMSLSSKLPADSLPAVKSKIENASEVQLSQVTLVSAHFKDPIIGLVLGVLLGSLGIDRFYKGDILLGALKLVTLGGFGIWMIVDLFLVFRGIKRDNLEKLLMVI